MIGKPSRPILVELEYDVKGECIASQIIRPSEAFDDASVNYEDIAFDLYVKHNNGAWIEGPEGRISKWEGIKPKWRFI